MEAYEFVHRLDDAGKIADFPNDEKQKTFTISLRDEIPKRDFAKPVAARVSKAFGPVSRFLTAQILPQMCHASRASRPWLTVGILRVLCNGMCTAQRFHIEGEEQRCRAGCQDEPDSLSQCPLLYNFCTSISGNTLQFCHGKAIFSTTWLPRFFLRSLQYGIVVMGVIDAFVMPTTTTVEMWITLEMLEIV